MSKKWLASFLASAALFVISNVSFASVDAPPKDGFSEETKVCVECHKKQSLGVVQQWGDSKHYRAEVGCYECHQADAEDVDAFIHEEFDKKAIGKNKPISIIVSPKDCSNCHEREVSEYAASHHSQGGRIIGSLDNLLADVIEGNRTMVTENFPNGVSAAVVNGCWQCHGSEVKMLKDEDGKVIGLDPATWPNTGIGRINPDKSRGSCSACHSRHKFSVEQARNPENCGKCHMGPDHPQEEIYYESKHGIAFHANKDKMNMDRSKWIAGEDYDAAPTCATCHMSATKDMPVNHDVGMRISWNNRPAISIRPEKTDAAMGLEHGASVGWEERRDNMKNVCSACHGGSFIENFYIQYDAQIELYNNKFAQPGLAMYNAAIPLLKRKQKFANHIDYTWFEIWHHEGRRARHGASMMGPDWTQWHGNYEVGKHFYSKYLPEIEELIEDNTDSKVEIVVDGKTITKGEQAAELKRIYDLVVNDQFEVVDVQTGKTVKSTGHLFYSNNMPKAEAERRMKERQEFVDRYEGKTDK
ncbi:MAG: cytochrome C552 [Thiomargarita sp.]|nr:cytochrome C552 [Thiomargarita sp.]